MTSNRRRIGFIACIVVVVLAAASMVFSQTGWDRSERRAFYQAPPVIPHEVMDETNETCLMCHSEVVTIGDETTIKTPHPQYFNCTQCHVTIASHDGQESPPVASDFIGLEEPTEGSRATPVSPPTIPHRMFLREDCLSCHHPDHPNEALRCPHPERDNCLQCHVADLSLEF